MLGVSVIVPEPHARVLSGVRAEIGDPLAATVPPHVTLLPPTEVPDDVREDFVRHLDDVAQGTSRFRMLLRSTGTFRPVSPVVFVMVSQGIAECEQLEQAVRGGPVQRELEFNYHPHVTVGHHVDDDALDRAFDRLARFSAEFTVSGFELREQNPDGSWSFVRSFRFSGR